MKLVKIKDTLVDQEDLRATNNLVLNRSERSPKEIIKEMKQNKTKAKKSEKPENAKKDDTFEK